MQINIIQPCHSHTLDKAIAGLPGLGVMREQANGEVRCMSQRPGRIANAWSLRDDGMVGSHNCMSPRCTFHKLFVLNCFCSPGIPVECDFGRKQVQKEMPSGDRAHLGANRAGLERLHDGALLQASRRILRDCRDVDHFTVAVVSTCSCLL